MAIIIDTKNIQEKIITQIKEKNKELKEDEKHPTLAIVSFGTNSDDIFYAKSIMKKFNSLGIAVETLSMGNDYETDKNRFLLTNEDEGVNGIIVIGQVPNIYKSIINTMNPCKDVDCYLDANLFKIFADDYPYFYPCTPLSCMEILKVNNINVKGKKILIIGRSLIVGRPLAMMLLNKDATVTIAHSKTDNLGEMIKGYDIIISCVGKAKFLKGTFFNDNQIIIDVGINFDESGKVCGDVDFETVAEKNILITPVPGGVGAITTLMLAKQVVDATYDSFE